MLSQPLAGLALPCLMTTTGLESASQPTSMAMPCPQHVAAPTGCDHLTLVDCVGEAAANLPVLTDADRLLLAGKQQASVAPDFIAAVMTVSLLEMVRALPQNFGVERATVPAILHISQRYRR